MKVIGLIGGIASGKSAVAAELAKLGAVVLDADRAAHELLDQSGVQSALVERWGKDILQPDGRTDRQRIGAIVFAKNESASQELQFLEQTLHPRIRSAFETRLGELRAEKAEVAVIDAPLLLEAGWQELCDRLIYIDSSHEDRLARASRRGWSAAEFAKREACQMPIAEKRQRSTDVLKNSGSLGELHSQILSFWQSLDAR